MADLALDPDTGDLLVEDGTLSIVRDDDALVQHLGLRLRFVKGEWFLDTRVGIPYYQSILVKNPSLVAVGSFFRRAILSTPGIASIGRFDLTHDRATRVASLSFEARKDDGTTLSFEREFTL